MTVWEILCSGKMPYEGLSNSQICDAVKRGMRPQSPRKQGGVQPAFAMLQHCWRRIPSERPTADDIRETLEECAEMLVGGTWP